jgi:alpha-beta hydrolase superfamily lysophospholipase
MRSERVWFEGAQGDRIVGMLDLPDGEPRAFGIFAHCFTCSKNVRVVPEVARQLNAEGLALLRFDFTGIGQSGGAFERTTFRTNTRDLVAAAAFLEANHRPPAFVVGHSLGGAAVLSIAADLPGIRCVSTIAAPAEASHVRRLLAGARFDEHDVAEVAIGGRTFPLGRAFVEDLETHDVLARTRALRLPLLVFHAPGDRVVGIDHAERIFEAARHPKSFVSLDDADHLVSDPAEAAFLGHMLAAWAGHYV